MKISKSLLTVAALLTSITASANAQVTGSLGGGIGPYLSLSPVSSCTPGPCTLGPGVGTIVGGTIYQTDLPFADVPAGTVFENRFLAAGPTSGSPSTLTFTAPLGYISFLWGSPDMYNTLTVNSFLGGAQVFTAQSLGFAQTNGNQAFSQYVQFTAAPGDQIQSLVFGSSQDAFEVANFTTTSVVPEPSTYALMTAGLMALGFAARRRKQV